MSVCIKILEFKNKKLKKEHLITGLTYGTVLSMEKQIRQSYENDGYKQKSISYRILSLYTKGKYTAVIAIHRNGLCMSSECKNLPKWIDFEKVYFTLSASAINNI